MRTSFRYLAAAVALVSMAACGDNATAPTATRTLSATSAPAFDYGHSSDHSDLVGDHEARYTLTNAGGTFNVNGIFTVDFPTNAVVCVAKSEAAPCETWTGATKEKVDIKATVHLGAKGLSVDFSPHIVFQKKSVKLSTSVFSGLLTSKSDYFLKNPSALRPFVISYTPNPSAHPVADYLTDPSLVTHFDFTNGIVWRYLNTMSGYMMGAGDGCVPTDTQPCG